MLGSPGIADVTTLTLEKPQAYVIDTGSVEISQTIAELVPETGTEDDVTDVTLSVALLADIANQYPLIALKAGAGYTITLVNGPNMILAGGLDVTLADDATFFGIHDGTKLVDILRSGTQLSLFDFYYFR